MLTVIYDTEVGQWTGWDLTEGKQFGGYYATVEEAQTGIVVSAWRVAQGWEA